MSKKHSNRQKPVLALPRRALIALDEANELTSHAQWAEARQLLEELNGDYPNQPVILAMLVNVCLEQSDMAGHLRVLESYIHLVPKDANLRLGLAGAYASNGFAALALRAFRDFLKHHPGHPDVGKVNQSITHFETFIAEMLAELEVPAPDGLRLLEMHEEVQINLSRGDYAKARRLAEDLTKRLPTFAPGWNNLTQACIALGRWQEAIAAARRVTEFEPDNVHALSNLTRCLYLNGNWEAAKATAERLIASRAKAVDGWLKKIEALSYTGDNGSILDVIAEARHSGETLDNPMFWHLAAVAAHRSGQPAQARQYWGNALKSQPGFDLAEANLKDLSLPIEKRNAPWAFDVSYWVNPAITTELRRLINAKRHSPSGSLRTAVEKLVHQHPELAQIAPVLLERAGPTGREFVITLAEISETPEIVTAVKEFALGQNGSDESRLRAAQVATKVNALPTGLTRMWIRGQWQELMMIGFELHGEPLHPYPHSPRAERLLLNYIQAARDGLLEEAESLIDQALALEPDKPDLLNNRAALYEATQRKQEANDIWRRVHEAYPDYLFAAAALARHIALEGDPEKAHTLLKPLFERRRLHFSEFSALSVAYIEILLAEGNKDGARSWFEIWEQTDPEDPKLEVYRRKVNAISLLPALLGKLRN